MTETNPATEEANRLRIAIANAMGLDPYWKCEQHSEIDGPACRWCKGVAVLTSGKDYLTPIPDYLTDPAAALSLVEHMRKEGFDWHSNNYTDEYWASFMKDGGHASAAFAPTFPLAISRAFASANQITP